MSPSVHSTFFGTIAGNFSKNKNNYNIVTTCRELCFHLTCASRILWMQKYIRNTKEERIIQGVSFLGKKCRQMPLRRKSAADLAFSYIKKAKQLRVLLAKHGFGFFGLGCFSDLPCVLHVRFASGFSFQLQYFKCLLESEDQSELCLLPGPTPFLEKPTQFKRKDGASFSSLCIGGMPSNQNAIVSEDKRLLYTDFKYPIN